MIDDANKPEIKLVDAAPPESVFDDLETLRKTATLKVSRRVVPINVAVRKPPNNVYFRCHEAPAMSLDASIIVGGDGSDDYFFVTRFREIWHCDFEFRQDPDHCPVPVAMFA